MLSYRVGLLYDVPPVLVHLVEPAALLWHLCHDVRRREDGLQIEPGGLHFQPLIENLLHQQQLALPLPAQRYKDQENVWKYNSRQSKANENTQGSQLTKYDES